MLNNYFIIATTLFVVGIYSYTYTSRLITLCNPLISDFPRKAFIIIIETATTLMKFYSCVINSTLEDSLSL
jgi:hypothetical protein